MSIFVKDPPNDPKTLYETRKHGSLKPTGHSSPSKHKANKHEVSPVHCDPFVFAASTPTADILIDYVIQTACLCAVLNKYSAHAGVRGIWQDDERCVVCSLLQNMQAVYISC